MAPTKRVSRAQKPNTYPSPSPTLSPPPSNNKPSRRTRTSKGFSTTRLLNQAALFEPALVGKAIADGRISSAAKEAFKRSRMTTGDRYFADLEKEKAQERANKKKRKHVFEPVHEELTSDATIEVHDSYILRQGKNVGVDAAETTKETLKRFRKTGFISIHDTPVVQARSGPPPPKARKRNDNTAFRLFPNTGQPFYSLYNAELCIQELESGHREKRIKYTKERLAKRDTTLQRLLLPALHIARQRPLLHMHKANSSTFNVIDPLRGGGSEPNYKLLRMPSLASQMRPREVRKDRQAKKDAAKLKKDRPEAAQREIDAMLVEYFVATQEELDDALKSYKISQASSRNSTDDDDAYMANYSVADSLYTKAARKRTPLDK